MTSGLAVEGAGCPAQAGRSQYPPSAPSGVPLSPGKHHPAVGRTPGPCHAAHSPPTLCCFRSAEPLPRWGGGGVCTLNPHIRGRERTRSLWPWLRCGISSVTVHSIALFLLEDSDRRQRSSVHFGLLLFAVCAPDGRVVI